MHQNRRAYSPFFNISSWAKEFQQRRALFSERQIEQMYTITLDPSRFFRASRRNVGFSFEIVGDFSIGNKYNLSKINP